MVNRHDLEATFQAKGFISYLKFFNKKINNFNSLKDSKFAVDLSERLLPISEKIKNELQSCIETHKKSDLVDVVKLLENNKTQ